MRKQIMNRCKWIVAICILCHTLTAQQTYFQQEVNYKISVTLNDKDHSLKATEEIQYVNNSDKGLTFIYFHLWPNAYKNNNTALAKQLLQHNNTKLHFSKPEERGLIDSLDFKVDGKTVKVEYDENNPDICKLILNEPLRSLDTIQITTPFYVKIPDAKFSRLGHTGQAYFITQWYPKPAVYDNSGWHPMPYLDQGEFYSEFGSFDVSITLPKNYLLSATGDRIDADEEEYWLNEKVGETIERLERKDYRADKMDFPPSSPVMKTVRFKQFRVHDFAWFADKRFNVIHDQITLPNTKRTVDTWVYFTNQNFELWKDAINYVNESTIFYSYLNGDYPYNNVTAVDGTIMAGGGMEYPNITVIGSMDNAFDLDVTIAHEVGHNWFYGILGSNERDYPAMDEGLNSFYELRYIRAKYPEAKLVQYLGRDTTFKFFGVNKIPYWKEKETGYFFTAKSNSDQPVNLPSQDFTQLNYGFIVYAKTAVVFDYLMDYMGEENLDKAMQFYFEQFKFKHPTPSDLSTTLSYFSGMDLTWLTQHLLGSTDKIDYKIKSVKRNTDGSYTLKLKNKTGVPTPLNVYGFTKGKPQGLVWFNGFKGTRTVGFPAAEIDYFKIDGLDRMPDINRKNNRIRTKGLFKKARPLKLSFITHFEDPSKTQVFYTPIAGINFYNGPMLGMAFHNLGVYERKFEYQIAPLYAFKTRDVTGFVDLVYHFNFRKTLRQINLGVKTKSFSYDYFETETRNKIAGTDHKDVFFRYIKFAPYLQFELKKKDANSPYNHMITLTNNNVLIDQLSNGPSLNNIALPPLVVQNNYFVNQLTYQLLAKKALHPFTASFDLQNDLKMTKLSASFNQKITVGKKNSMSIRVFAGAFLNGTEADRAPYKFRLSGHTGYQDYLFNGNYIARNEMQGLGFSQFNEVEGAMKTWSPYGQSTEWIAALNIKSPKLFILPVRVYADVATADGRSMYRDNYLWDAGINITLWKDIIDVYVPLAYSEDIKYGYDLNQFDFWQKIRFTLNLHKLAPKEYIKNSLF